MNGGKEGFETPSSSKKPPSISSRFKDPRVVRVSKAVGGKDRHSKVCTVRGLRDRRVRLSVPTAIQLYDLQERLGLNQPSKVVDWLLNAAKREIDELPPLQIPQGMFSFGNNHSSDHYNLDQPMLNFQEIGSGHREEDWGRNQDVDWHGFGLLPFQPTLASGYHHHHHQVAAGNMSTQSYLPLNGEMEQKHEVGFQRSSSLFGSAVDSSSQPLRRGQFNMTANLLPSQDDETGA